jgi:hypothetical protein
MAFKMDRVEGELEVGCNFRFEDRWWRLERLAWTLAFAVLAAGLLGLLGRGWLSWSTAGSEDGPLHVRYERLQRHGTPGLVIVRLGHGTAPDGEAHIWVEHSLLAGLAVREILPAPRDSELVPTGMVFSFHVPAEAQSTEVRFVVEAGSFGPVSGHLGLVGGAALPLSVFVFP